MLFRSLLSSLITRCRPTQTREVRQSCRASHSMPLLRPAFVEGCRGIVADIENEQSLRCGHRSVHAQHYPRKCSRNEWTAVMLLPNTPCRRCSPAACGGLIPCQILISQTDSTRRQKRILHVSTESLNIVYPEKLGEITLGSSSTHSTLSLNVR